MRQAFVPYVDPRRSLPELTVRGIILGFLLSVILGAANTFLGLRVGLTVSASIPAAVISLGILKLLRNSNVLENNNVQTAASAGESLAAGILFTIPALLLLEVWEDVQFIETTLLALAGGLLGVVFTISLRRAFIVEAQLRFPEGVATSEVIKAGMEGKEAGLGALSIGAGFAALYAFLQGGLQTFAGAFVRATRFGQDGVVSFGGSLSPALIGVGYIIGLPIATLVFLGGVMGYLIAIPIYSSLASDVASITGGAPAALAADLIWSARVRYIGAGAMLAGGLWTLIKLRGALLTAIVGIFKRNPLAAKDTLRTDRDLPGTFTGPLVGVLTILLYIMLGVALEDFLKAIPVTLLMVVLGYLFSGVGAYMAGLVGSSNNPISGVTILAVVSSALLLRVMGFDLAIGALGSIYVAAIIACAGAIGSDNVQDLKAGYLLGATPYRQQIMQIIGVTAAALTVPFVVQLLDEAYTIGSPELVAPQASLMAFLVQGTFQGGLPTLMLVIGALVALLVIVLDEILAARNAPFRTPVMAVAVGIYLPVGLTAPIFMGGLLAFLTSRALSKRVEKRQMAPEQMDARNRKGLLYASGLVAGEALIGIVIAILAANGSLADLDLGAGEIQFTGALLLLFLILVHARLILGPSRSES